MAPPGFPITGPHGPFRRRHVSIDPSAPADINFYFDPICPFAWMTSKWIRLVQAQRGYTVDWRFISLRLINSHLDYDSHFPAEYEAQHTAGLRLLRVASAVRERHGREAVGPLYAAFGARILETAPDEGRSPGWQGTPALAAD